MARKIAIAACSILVLAAALAAGEIVPSKDLRTLVSAAQSGDPYAQGALGKLYASGRGVPQDPVIAYKWFRLAAERIPEGEFRRLSAEHRDRLADVLTPTQLAEGRRLAAAWEKRYR